MSYLDIAWIVCIIQLIFLALTYLGARFGAYLMMWSCAFFTLIANAITWVFYIEWLVSRCA
nr:MAG TPA: hypothetical protein [Caudoviricetes sp.]